MTERKENTLPPQPPAITTAGWAVILLLLLAALIAVSRYNFLLFHGLAELFSITVAWAVFILVWNTRHSVKDDALLFLGIAYLFIGFVDMLHTLAYKGMGVFAAHWGANLPTQLWILARYMEGAALLAYPLLLNRRIRALPVICAWSLVTAVMLGAVFHWRSFPVCYVDGVGLTGFKIVSEYVICILLATGLLILWLRRRMLDQTVFRLMGLAVAGTIGAELAFTFYVSVYGLSNLVGHFLKILSFFMIYMALVRSGLKDPLEGLYKSLKLSEENYQNLFNSAQVGLFRLRRSDGRPLAVNDLMAALSEGDPSGVTVGEVAGDGDLFRRIHGHIQSELVDGGRLTDREIAYRTRDGRRKWLSVSANLDRESGCIEGAAVDITDRVNRERVQAALLRFVDHAAEHPVQDLLVKFLDEAEALTESRIGFFHFVSADQEVLQLQAWSTATLAHHCTAEGDGLHYPVSRAGVWVDCVAARRPVIHNDYAALPHKKGMPPGHAAVHRELVVPVIRGGKVTAILGVGNKSTIYDEEDVKTIQALADAAWEIVVRKRAEEQLQAAKDTLEGQVAQRTRELSAAVFELESLFNSSQVGMMVLRGGRYFSKGNQRLADILGYGSPEEMNGFSMAKLHLTEGRFHAFGKRYYDALRLGEVLHVEYELRRKDGAPVWCSLSGAALDPDRPPDLNKGVLWIIDDISDRKAAEARLRLQAQILDQVHDSVVTIDRSGRITGWNAGAEQMFDYRAAEAIGRSLSLIYPVESHPHLDQEIIPSVLSHGSYDMEATLIRSAGGRFDALMSLSVLNDEDGRSFGMVCYILDISERKRYERHLRESEAKFRSLFNVAAIPLCYVDAEGAIVDINPKFTQTFGYASQDIPTLEAWWPKAYPDPGYRQWVRDTWTRAVDRSQVAGGDIEPIEYQVTCKNGDVRRVIISGATIQDHFLATFVDITELKQAQERFAKFFTIISDMFCIVDLEGRFRLVNPAATDILGYTDEEFMARPFIEFVHPEDRERTLAAVEAQVTQGVVIPNFLNRYMCKDGGFKWLEWSSHPMPDERLLYAVARDCTERLEAENRLRQTLQELERSNAELEQFAYVASHDLQEPLRAVVGFLQLLQVRYDDRLDEKGRHYIERSVSAGHRMQMLINDLLTLSRISTRGRRFQQTDLNDVMKSVMASLQPTIEEKGAEVNFGFLPSLCVDGNQIHSLILNLMTNALKYNRNRRPMVDIACHGSDDGYIFSVSDNGIGVPEAFHERIFLLFQRLHTQKEYPGTGMGLALCKKIVERHGGAIWVESDAGQGATFYFKLPKKGDQDAGTHDDTTRTGAAGGRQRG